MKAKVNSAWGGRTVLLGQYQTGLEHIGKELATPAWPISTRASALRDLRLTEARQGPRGRRQGSARRHSLGSSTRAGLAAGRLDRRGQGRLQRKYPQPPLRLERRVPVPRWHYARRRLGPEWSLGRAREGPLAIRRDHTGACSSWPTSTTLYGNDEAGPSTLQAVHTGVRQALGRHDQPCVLSRG